MNNNEFINRDDNFFMFLFHFFSEYKMSVTETKKDTFLSDPILELIGKCQYKC